MPFDFPNTPAEGSTYSPAGGPQYVYSGGVWRQVSSPSLKLTAVPQNLIVNGGFQVSQENGDTAGGVVFYYPADQWFMSFSGIPAGVQRFLQNTGLYGVSFQNNSAQAAPTGAQYLLMQQTFEGLRLQPLMWGTSHAIPAVLSFKSVCSSPATYSVSLRNAAADRSITFDVVHPAGSVMKDFSFPIPAITSGVWNNYSSAAGGVINFTHSCGPSHLGGVQGVWNNASYLATPTFPPNCTAVNSYQIFNVGLYPDPDGTGVAPKFISPDWASELRDCQRYYQRVGHDQTAFTTTPGTMYSLSVPLPVVMRTTPALANLVVGTPAGGANASATNASADRMHQVLTTSSSGTTFSIAGRINALSARM